MSSYLGVLLTVLSGVLVFILGQLFLELFIKPLKKHREIKAKVVFILIYYANIFLNPITLTQYNEGIQKDDYNTTQKELRQIASEIACLDKYWINKPNTKKMNKVTNNLIGLSNSIIGSESHLMDVSDSNEKRVKEIKKLLGIKNDNI